MPRVVHRLARAVAHCYPFACGQGRVIDRSALGRLRFDEPTLKVRCSEGFEMTVIPNDHIGRHLYLTGAFDRNVLQVLLSFCRGGERVLDIGANVGYISCGLLHGVKDCRVAAVDPQPHIFKLLTENIAAVGGDRGIALAVAVSDTDGAGRMVVHATNTGASHVIPAEEGSEQPNAVPIQFVTGERLLEMSGLDRVDLIKIDVEGHEEPVLRTLLPVMRRYRPRAVLFEHAGDLALDTPIRQIFDDLGYRLSGLHKRLTGWSLQPLAALSSNGIRAHDYVAVPA